jgi:hypothetical protein
MREQSEQLMSEQIMERRVSIRRRSQHPARILYKTSLSEESHSPSRPVVPTLLCHTRDVSEAGLALIVPCLRESDYNFYGIRSELQITLSTPHGVIDEAAEAVRFEWLDEGDKSEGFLIGVRFRQS